MLAWKKAKGRGEKEMHRIIVGHGLSVVCPTFIASQIKHLRMNSCLFSRLKTKNAFTGRCNPQFVAFFLLPAAFSCSGEVTSLAEAAATTAASAPAPAAISAAPPGLVFETTLAVPRADGSAAKGVAAPGVALIASPDSVLAPP
jgi:hypothetical protein